MIETSLMVYDYPEPKWVNEEDEEDEEETFYCNNCGETYELDEMGTSELAREEEICVYCMGDGYGE